jgi:hypothetical protein
LKEEVGWIEIMKNLPENNVAITAGGKINRRRL